MSTTTIITLSTLKAAAEALNKSRETATAATFTADLAALNADVEKFNEDAQTARMEELVKLPRADFWREYTAEPTYNGAQLKNGENGYSVEEKALSLRITKLEKFFQLSESTTKNSKGEPVPNRGVSLFADPHYNAMALLVNGYLSEAMRKDCEAKLSDELVTASATVKETLKNLPACFQKNNSNNRLAMLQALVNAMLPEELAVKVLSCDVRYLSEAMHKAGKGTIKGAGESLLLDEVCYIIHAGLSVDAKTGKRTVQYTYTSQSKYYAKANK